MSWREFEVPCRCARGLFHSFFFLAACTLHTLSWWANLEIFKIFAGSPASCKYVIGRRLLLADSRSLFTYYSRYATVFFFGVASTVFLSFFFLAYYRSFSGILRPLLTCTNSQLLQFCPQYRGRPAPSVGPGLPRPLGKK